MDYETLNLSPAEWQVLSRLPIKVAAAATIADSSRDAGSTRELLAALSTLLAGVKLLRHNELVQTVFDAYKLDGQGEAEILQLSQDPPPDLVETTLTLVRQASLILAGRADQNEAAEFKLWLRGVAAEIISSSASGGFLGFGGTSVTDEEVSFLDRLTEALGLEIVSGDDPPA